MNTTYMQARALNLGDYVIEADGYTWKVDRIEYLTAKTMRVFLIPMGLNFYMPRWKTLKRSASVRVPAEVKA